MQHILGICTSIFLCFYNRVSSDSDMDQSRGRSIFYVQPHAEYTIYSSSSPKFIYVCKNLSFTMLNYLRSNPSTARTHCGWNRFFRRAERNGTELLNIHLRADARSSNIRYWPHRNNTTSQRFGYEELGWLWISQCFTSGSARDRKVFRSWDAAFVNGGRLSDALELQNKNLLSNLQFVWNSEFGIVFLHILRIEIPLFTVGN